MARFLFTIFKVIKFLSASVEIFFAAVRQINGNLQNEQKLHVGICRQATDTDSESGEVEGIAVMSLLGSTASSRRHRRASWRHGSHGAER